MNVPVLGYPVISNVDETLEIALGNFTEDSKANALDNDDRKDDNES